MKLQLKRRPAFAGAGMSFFAGLAFVAALIDGFPSAGQLVIGMLGAVWFFLLSLLFLFDVKNKK